MEIRIERRRGRSLWPWVIGLLVLALLIWGIAELVNTDRDNATMAQADSAAAPAANAAASSPSVSGPAAPAAERPSNEGTTPLGALVPLGVQDVGQTVSATGMVLSKPAHGGFWLRSEGDVIIWAKSGQTVKPGQQLQDLQGTLERAQPGEAEQWLQGTDVQRQAARSFGSAVTTDLYLDLTASEKATVTARAHGARAATTTRNQARGRRGAAR